MGARRVHGSPSYALVSEKKRTPTHIATDPSAVLEPLPLSSKAPFRRIRSSPRRGRNGRKGTIAIGSDADLSIWDPEREVTMSIDVLHDEMDYTPYEGMSHGLARDDGLARPSRLPGLRVSRRTRRR